jgi:hypothetical protein
MTEYEQTCCPIGDEDFHISETETFQIPVEFSARPDLGTGGMRGLNIPEILALGLHIPDHVFLAVAQPLRRPFGLYVAYVVQRAVGLMPAHRIGRRMTPVTQAQNPLA